MIAHGSHNPAPADFDPVGYQFRAVLLTNLSVPEGDTLIAWLDSAEPFDTDAVEAMRNVLARGGGILLLARDQVTLDRVRAAAEMVAGTPAEAWA